MTNDPTYIQEPEKHYIDGDENHWYISEDIHFSRHRKIFYLKNKTSGKVWAYKEQQINSSINTIDTETWRNRIGHIHREDGPAMISNNISRSCQKLYWYLNDNVIFEFHSQTKKIHFYYNTKRPSEYKKHFIFQNIYLINKKGIENV